MSSYWERRQEEDMYQYMEEAEIAADEIAKIYRKASGYLSAQADSIFEKFRSRYGLSEAEARKLLNQVRDKGSLDEILSRMSVGDREAKQELLKLLEAPAYQARLERLRQIQNQLDILMRTVYRQEKDFSTSFYMDLANESYYRNVFNIQQQAGAAFGFSHVSARTIERIIRSRWSGVNYSERIWRNTETLAAELKEELLINFITGRSNREASEIIARKFAAGASNARRLVRTESNFIACAMNFEACEACGVEEYQYLATLDLRTSETCRELDGKIFPVKDRQTGKNCPPMHPWCRSTTVSVIDRALLEKMQRSAVDPATGKRIQVPRTMTYRQWYDQYVKGNAQAELNEKMIKNRSADRKQYAEYKKILGGEIPESLDSFQKMKYNKPEEWQRLKEAYRDVRWQRKALENQHDSSDARSVPFEYKPNSVYDKVNNGEIVQRRYFGRTGKPRLDIDLTDHGNPKEHTTVPHYHDWNEKADGRIERDKNHNNPLKLGHRIANADLLGGDESEYSR